MTPEITGQGSPQPVADGYSSQVSSAVYTGVSVMYEGLSAAVLKILWGTSSPDQVRQGISGLQLNEALGALEEEIRECGKAVDALVEKIESQRQACLDLNYQCFEYTMAILEQVLEMTRSTELDVTIELADGGKPLLERLEHLAQRLAVESKEKPLSRFDPQVLLSAFKEVSNESKDVERKVLKEASFYSSEGCPHENDRVSRSYRFRLRAYDIVLASFKQFFDRVAAPLGLTKQALFYDVSKNQGVISSTASRIEDSQSPTKRIELLEEYEKAHRNAEEAINKLYLLRHEANVKNKELGLKLQRRAQFEQFSSACKKMEEEDAQLERQFSKLEIGDSKALAPAVLLAGSVLNVEELSEGNTDERQPVSGSGDPA